MQCPSKQNERPSASVAHIVRAHNRPGLGMQCMQSVGLQTEAEESLNLWCVEACGGVVVGCGGGIVVCGGGVVVCGGVWWGVEVV